MGTSGSNLQVQQIQLVWLESQTMGLYKYRPKQHSGAILVIIACLELKTGDRGRFSNLLDEYDIGYNTKL